VQRQHVVRVTSLRSSSSGRSTLTRLVDEVGDPTLLFTSEALVLPMPPNFARNDPPQQSRQRHFA